MLKQGISTVGLLISLMILTLSVFRTQTQQDALSVVENYQLLHNTEQIEAVMALFADDAEFELVGQGILTGDGLQAIHEYDTAINSRLAFINCQMDSNTVTCQAVEFNDWLEIAGLQPVFYTSSVFTLDDGKIVRISATMSSQSAQMLGETLEAFIPWLKANRLNDALPLFTSDGVFIYSQNNGELVLQLLQEWHKATD